MKNNELRENIIRDLIATNIVPPGPQDTIIAYCVAFCLDSLKAELVGKFEALKTVDNSEGDIFKIIDEAIELVKKI